MLHINVNDKLSFELDGSGDNFDWDIQEIDSGHYHIIKNNISYNVYVLKSESNGKSLLVRVNEHVFDIQIKDQYDLLLKKLGMSGMTASKINQIKAPMPGLVLDVIVKEGDEVKKGDQILILEAMKMENIIKSPGDGIIKKIKISKGDPVEKNEMLIELA